MRKAILLLTLAIPLACRSYPDYPVPERQVSFGSPTINARVRGSAPPVAQGVAFNRIRNARSEPQNWLTYYGAYDGQRYSTLDQITTANVLNLRPAWNFQFAPVGLMAHARQFSFEAAPIVVDEVMYVSGWDGYVWALDATNGDLLWQYQHAIPIDTRMCCGNVNRGVAVAGVEPREGQAGLPVLHYSS